MPVDWHELVGDAFVRWREAKRIAAKLQHDPDLHRLAMQTVFVLEDTAFRLKEIADAQKGADGRRLSD